MKEKNIMLTNGQVKDIFEYFARQLRQDGKNAAYSYMIYKNAERLTDAYKNVVSKIYNENADAKFQEFKMKANELFRKYADRDDQGNIKLDEKGQPIITEQFNEFKEENDKLTKDNEELFAEYKKKIDETRQMLSQQSEYYLFTIGLSDFPNDTLPGIVGLFAEV